MLIHKYFFDKIEIVAQKSAKNCSMEPKKPENRHIWGFLINSFKNLQVVLQSSVLAKIPFRL